MKKVVLITGALGGIGKALCKIFYEEHWFVIGTDIRIKDIAPHCEIGMHLDLDKLCKDEGYRASVLTHIEQYTNKLDLLINNAAVQLLSPTESIALADWYETMNVNLTAPM
ncbi:MAG: SDR family oxidoreductase, partial [Thermoflexibacter sp.]|nr:SDR family oxidoreductase [Thermoflexibacter sp.]